MIIVALLLVGCGSVGASRAPLRRSRERTSETTRAHPQIVEPIAGVQAAPTISTDPIGNPNAHPRPLSEVRKLLLGERVAAKQTDAAYVDPLGYVTVWGRTDQGVDATMPIGAPILAPGPVKILAIIPDWYLTQPLVYFELLSGAYAGKLQYVAEQISEIAPPGSFVPKGGVIARFAAHGTGIEYGWSTIDGVTLAKATTGYEEGQVTPAGEWMRSWLNTLGANAGKG